MVVVFREELQILPAGVVGEQVPIVHRIGGLGWRVLPARLLRLHLGAAVGQAGDEADHGGDAEFLGKVEGRARHGVGLLLIGGFEAGDQGEVGEVAAVLLVLRGVHAGVIRHGQDQTRRGFR